MAKQKLISYGISKEKITITGIPIMPHFFKSYSDEELNILKNKWNVNNNLTKILLMAGGAGVGNLDIIAKTILEKNNKVQLIALAGKNEETYNNLLKAQEIYHNKLISLKFTNEVHELMQISDLVLTKPGGLSTSECIAMKKVMLLVNPIPGQEEHNAEYLESLGIAKLSSNVNVDMEKILEDIEKYKKSFDNILTYNTEELIKNKIRDILFY